jgi:hypothetical protein
MGTHPSHLALLVAEVVVGVISYAIALYAVDRPLVEDVFRVAALAVPGGERIARRMHVPLAHSRLSASRLPIDIPAGDEPEQA